MKMETERKLIKSKNGVTLFAVGDIIEMYLEEYLVLTVHKDFSDMVMKSYDNLVNLRKDQYNKKS